MKRSILILAASASLALAVSAIPAAAQNVTCFTGSILGGSFGFDANGKPIVKCFDNNGLSTSSGGPAAVAPAAPSPIVPVVVAPVDPVVPGPVIDGPNQYILTLTGTVIEEYLALFGSSGGQAGVFFPIIPDQGFPGGLGDFTIYPGGVVKVTVTAPLPGNPGGNEEPAEPEAPTCPAGALCGKVADTEYAGTPAGTYANVPFNGGFYDAVIDADGNYVATPSAPAPVGAASSDEQSEPVVESVVVEVIEAPVEAAPVVEAPAEEAPAAEEPAQEDAPADETPAEEAPAL